MTREQELRRAIIAGRNVANRCDMSDPDEKKLAESEIQNAERNEQRLLEFLEKKKNATKKKQ